MIRVCHPLFAPQASRNLQNCIETGWVSSAGSYVKQFEEQMAFYHDLPHALAVSSGTAALETGLFAAGLKPGDEVLLPNLTMIACASSIVRLGLVPVPVEVDPQTWNIDPKDVKRKLTKKSRALMLVHLFGLPCDMASLMPLAKEAKLFVIEDCAQALGSTYDGQKLGTFGDVAAFSFFANKIITTGEGGMLLARREEHAQRAALYRNLFLGAGSDRFEHQELGMNYRLSNLQAAVGVAQFEQLDKILELKKTIAYRYDNAFKKLKLQLPYTHPQLTSNHWMYALVLPKGGKTDAQKLSSILRDEGIESRRFFLGLHRQPALKKYPFGHFSVSDQLYHYGLYIPSGPRLEQKDQQRVIEVIANEVDNVA